MKDLKEEEVEAVVVLKGDPEEEEVPRLEEDNKYQSTKKNSQHSEILLIKST